MSSPSLISGVGPNDPKLAQVIGAERVRMLFAPTPMVVAMSTGFTLALAGMAGAAVGWMQALIWAAMCLVAGGVRMLHWRAYMRSEHRGDTRWLHGLMVVCALHGACWGMAGIWMMPVHDLVTTSMIVSTLIGASAVGTFTLQAHIGPNLCMTVPMLLPAAVMLTTRLDSFGAFGAFGIVSLGAVMLVESRRSERRFTELLWLRFTTDRISQERADALKLAQRHSAVKDQFLATMSHEMRTPLHGILGLAQLVRQRLPAKPGPLADARQHAALIERSGEHLLSLINDVLDFSRIESGKLHIESEVFDLRTVLDDVLALSRVNAAEKHLALRDRIDLPRPCLVEGDPARVRQVLYNLLGNAIKFTECGHIELSAHRRACPDDHPEDEPDDGLTGCARRISFHVRDTGAGIPVNDIDRIFDAFQQLDGSFGRRHQGTGLGLTISREIARAMGGDIVCTSTMNEGSTFTLTVPLPIASTAASGSDAASEQASRAPLANEQNTLPSAHDTSTSSPTARHTAAKRRRADTDPDKLEPLTGHVLLVEDNPVNALVAQATMSQLGLNVTLVTDGQQALDMLTPGPHGFDAVLMDCQMPVLDGIEATRRLRVHENEIGGPNIPVIALTANAMPQDRKRCSAAGMDDHLAKPFRQDELREVLSRHLHPRRDTVTA